jgi:uncharacterized membrane protein YbhN (UPF0104 family)
MSPQTPIGAAPEDPPVAAGAPPSPAPPPTDPTPPPRWRARAMLALRVGISVAGLIYLLDWEVLSGLDAVVHQLPRWVWGVPLLTTLTNTTLLTVRHRLALEATGLRIPYWALFTLHLRSSFAGLVMPRGGADLVRLTALTQATGQLEAVLAAGLLLRLADLATWLGFLTLFLALRPWPGLEVLEIGVMVFVLAGAAGVGIALWLVLLGQRAAPVLGRLPWIGGRVAGLVRALNLGLRQRRIAVQVLLLGLPMATLNVLSVSLLFQAAGAELSALRAFGLVPAMDAAMSLPIALGGIGLREGVFAMVGGTLGLTQGQAYTLAWLRWSGELGRGLLGGLSTLVGGRPLVSGGGPR